MVESKVSAYAPSGSVTRDAPDIAPVDITFHAGAHKTASTHLQQIFARRERALARRALRYFGPQELRASGQSLGQFLGVQADPAARQAILAKLLDGRQELLISEENYIGLLIGADGLPAHKRLYPNAARRLNRLAETLAPHRMHLALAVRNPADLMVSAYSQALFGGSYRPWEAFIAQVELEALSWADMLRPVAQAGHFASITLWRYEDYHSLFDTVLDTLLGSERPQVSAALEHRAHPGLSADAVDACARWARAGYEGRLGVIAREDYPVSDVHPKFQPWSPVQQWQAEKHYAADLAKLAALPGVTLLQAPAGKP